MSDISIGRFRGGFCVYWDERGKRRRYQLTARTRAEAEPEAIDKYREKTLKKDGAKVADIWQAYIKHLSDKPTAKTMGYTGKAILPHFGAFRPDQIGTDLCRDYANVRDLAGKAQGTTHTELGHLRSAMKFAEQQGIISKAPYIERPAKPMPKERFITGSDVAQLVAAASAPHIKLAIHLLFATAGRIGAILDLTWDRVDMERGIIDLRLGSAKTRKGRAIVPMNRGLRAALQTARDAALSEFVVEYSGGQVKSIRKGFDNASKSAGIENVTLHTIRHSAAVAMISAGMPIEKVGQFLGHSNVAITYSTYARYAPEHLEDAAEILDFTAIKSIRQ